MNILICGDRAWNNITILRSVIKDLIAQYGTFTLIHGDANGADRLSGHVAKYSFGLEVMVFPALWDTHGKKAGPIRNRQMLSEGKPDLVIAFHNDLEHSKGTKDMLKIAGLAGIPRIWYTEAGLQFDERGNR
jgi:hypothetical protein